MSKNIEDLFTEPTTTGITYITRPDSQWNHKGINMVDDGFPVQIDIELNTTCNLHPSCIMCFMKDCPPKPKNMSVRLAKKIITEAAYEGAESVKLQYRGEPLIYPYIEFILWLAKQKGLFVHFNTNGMALSENIMDALVYNRVDKIIFSIDGSSPRTYEKIRPGAKFETVWNNVIHLKKKKQKLRSEYPLIGVHGIIHDINKREMKTNFFKTFWLLWADEIAYMEIFDMIDDSIDMIKLPRWHCAQLWQRLIVLVDGTVVPCCSGVDFKNKIVYSLGNLRNQSLKEIWNSKKSKALKKAHRKGNSHTIEMCQKCRIRKNVVQKIKVVEKNG